MNNPAHIVAYIFAASSVFVMFLAALIKYKKMVNLISGYDRDRYHNPGGLANWVGGTMLVTGLSGLILSVLIMACQQYLPVLVAVFAVFIIGGVVIAAFGSRKYRIKD
jgi:purine-cytosine permease-like protein